MNKISKSKTNVHSTEIKIKLMEEYAGQGGEYGENANFFPKKLRISAFFSLLLLLFTNSWFKHYMNNHRLVPGTTLSHTLISEIFTKILSLI